MPLHILVLISILTLLLILKYHGYGRVFGNIIVFAFVLLVVFQITTTNIQNTYSFTPSEIDQQIQRMNYYPSKLAKLGYILETKMVVKYTEVVISNFIKTVDFNSYFPDYFPLITLPLFFYGVYSFFFELTTNERKSKNSTASPLRSSEIVEGRRGVYCLLFIVSFFSILGLHGKYGPFLIFPYIVLFVYLGIIKLLKTIKLL